MHPEFNRIKRIVNVLTSKGILKKAIQDITNDTISINYVTIFVLFADQVGIAIDFLILKEPTFI